MTAPLTPVAGDLRDFPHVPIFRAKLFGSTFHAQANDAEWRAGVTLWLKAWDQVPAGSLPCDDVSLCRLAELGRDIKSWLKVKTIALHGWAECSDGRLYHPTVADGVNNALAVKVAQRSKTANARIAGLTKKMDATTSDSEKAHYAAEILKVQQGQLKVQSLTAKPAVTAPVPNPVTDTDTESKRRQGEEKERKGEEKVKGYVLDNSTPPKGGKRVKTPKSGTEDPPGFVEWYTEYRRKDARKDAVKAWLALAPDADLQERMLAALRRWPWREDNSFNPLPASWLRGERWTDIAVTDTRAEVPDWCKVAGFDNVHEAANFGCYAHTAHQFKNRQRVAAEVAA